MCAGADVAELGYNASPKLAELLIEGERFSNIIAGVQFVRQAERNESEFGIR